jgi:hypothetical protein
MSATVQSCLRSIHTLNNHGYEVRLWNESNYDVTASPLVHEHHQHRRWALVSDYARLDLLHKYGGIYLDTDVEVVKPFDELLNSDFFIGFMWDCTLGTAVLGSVPGHWIVADLLEQYDRDPATLKPPNNNTFTEYFLKRVPGFALNGKAQNVKGVAILGKYAFEQPSFLSRLNYTIHHFEQSWHTSSQTKARVKALVIKLFSLWLYRKYVCWRSLRISPFYEAFKRVHAEAPP